MRNRALTHNPLALDEQSGSRGERVRRLDVLLDQLRTQREKMAKAESIVYAVDLERLRKEVRYCCLDAGRKALKLIKEIDAIDFRKGELSTVESLKARYGWIDPFRCSRVFDVESERQCLGKLDRLIRLVENVREIEETDAESEAEPVTPELDAVLKLRSLSQIQTADMLGISPRTVRDWIKRGQLHKTAKGRIACDDKFVEQYHARYTPLKK